MLLVVPKALVGQWQSQLYELFGIVVRQGVLDPEAFAGPGVFLAHRELAGGARGASVLKAVEPFDLVVVDEAHELFASLYKRYGKEGNYTETSPHAQIAGRLREVAQRGPSPVILLTATPLQNSLAELWGLIQYVEPTGTLLGTLPTFRELFCEAGDRRVQPDQEEELKRRLATVLQRTLRRDAQPFLEVPFVERRARLFDVTRSPEERALHDEVTAWLMGPDLVAFDRRYRHLLSIAFQRRMASSLAALAESLDKVAARLAKREVGSAPPDGRELLQSLGEGLDDLEALADPTADGADEGAEEESEEPSEFPSTTGTVSARARLEAELSRVRGFIARARALGHDAKAERLLDVLRFIDERARDGTGSGKAVVFTEARATAVYLRDLLLARGYAPEDVALFQGDNETPEAVAALARWETDVGHALSQERRPQRDVALRLAIVHAFQTRARVLVSTEAGAKGLNLQFCDTVINFDLPWNPQRIEQRIGRVHRYGQRRGVTVVGFVAKDDEVQALTLELLTRKLDLFGTVLGASDQVLHTPSGAAPETLAFTVGADFERELRAIHTRARSQEEVATELRAMRDAFDGRRREYEEQRARASKLVDSRLGESVRGVLGDVKAALGTALSARDRDVERLVHAMLDEVGAHVTREEGPGRLILEIGPNAELPRGLDRGLTAIVGDPRDTPGEPLHVGHPLVRAAVARAREATARPLSAGLIVPVSGGASLLTAHVGKRGRLVATMVAHRGIERVDSLVRTVVVEDVDGPRVLSEAEIAALVTLHAVELKERDDTQAIAAIEPEIERALLADQANISALAQDRYGKLMRQLEDYRRDQIQLVERRLARIREQLDELTEKRSKATNSQALSDLARRITEVEKEASVHETAIVRLEDIGDEKLVLWRERLLARRFIRPTTTRVLDVAFTLVGERGGHVLKLLHTADLHLGYEYQRVEEGPRRRLAQARLKVVDRILRAAKQYDVAAILMAGDLFDSPEPHEDWWRGFADALSRGSRGWERPIVLLPGNHDPVRVGSVYHREHAFRRALPAWVHVVDAPGFELPLGEHAVVLANPCTTEAGAEDLALALPERVPVDTRLRIGLVHGSTFDLEGHQTNFPIAADAPTRRGLDYLAIGDTHGYRILPRADAVAPIVYPGAPEPTSFGEQGAGGVGIVHLERPGLRPQLLWERIHEWTFREVIIRNVAELRALAVEDTSRTVLRLCLQLTVSPVEAREVERQLVLLAGDQARRGRAGALSVDRAGYRVRAEAPESLLSGAPDAVIEVAHALKGEGSDAAAHALRLLADLYSEAAGPTLDLDQDPLVQAAPDQLSTLIKEATVENGPAVKLIELEVQSFKKVRQVVVKFGPHVTVLHGPNEVGKSTLAEAIRAALLVPIKTKESEAFIPWAEPAAQPRVVLTFEVDGARYRVDKTFGARAKSVLERADLASPSKYRPVVEGRGVDGRLRELLSWGVPGPATRGAPRKATSFLVTALLGQQGNAAEIFETSLQGDDDPSGRKRVTKALGALGRDPKVEALLAKLKPRVERSFTETGLPRRTSDAPRVQARENLHGAEDEFGRLAAKDAAATQIAASLAARVQEHESRTAEVEAQRAKLEEARAAAAREGERVQRTVEVTNLSEELAAGEQRVGALGHARRELDTLAAREASAAQVVESSGAALAGAKTEFDAAEVELTHAKATAAQLALEEAERRHINEARAAEITRVVATRDAAERALTEAQKRLALADEQVGAVRERRELAEREHKKVERDRDTAREGLPAKRAAHEQALAAKATAEAAQRPLREEEARRREMEARLAGERQRAAAERERAQRAYEDGVARRSSTASEAEAGTRGREAAEAQLHETRAQLDARSPHRHILLWAGVGVCLASVIAWLAGSFLPLSVAGILGGLALIAIGFRKALRISRLKEQLAAQTKDLSEAKVTEARIQAELEAARKLCDQLEHALNATRANENALMAAGAADPARSVPDAQACMEDVEAKLDSANDALKRADEKVTQLESQLKAASDAMRKASVDEATKQAEQKAAQTDADRRAVEFTRAHEDEARVVKANAPASVEEQAAPASRVLAGPTERHLQAKSTLAEAEDAQRAARAALAEAQLSLATQREVVARIDGEVAQLQLEPLRDRLAVAVRALAQHGERAMVTEMPDVRVVEEAYAHSARELERCKAELHQVKGALHHAGGHATRERLEDQRDLVADRQAALEELEREEQAAYRLFSDLQQAEQARSADLGRALAKPVAERFAELTGGAYQRVSLDANLTDAQLSVSGAERRPGHLSVGARDQLATLMRLALAAQLRSPLLLDDQLVHSDAQRNLST